MRFLPLLVIVFFACQSQPGAQQPLGSSRLIYFVEQSINSRNLDALDPYFSRDAKIYEQGSIDESWSHYRDGHLGQEIKEFEEFKLDFEIEETFEGSEMAFARGYYNLSAVMEGKPITSRGLVTFAMERADSTWQIIHLQFSRSCR